MKKMIGKILNFFGLNKDFTAGKSAITKVGKTKIISTDKKFIVVSPDGRYEFGKNSTVDSLTVGNTTISLIDGKLTVSDSNENTITVRGIK